MVQKLCLVGPPLLTAVQIAYLEQTLLPFEPTGAYIAAIWERTARKSSEIPAALLYREAILTLHAGTQLSAAYYAVFEQDFAGQLATINCPTLLLAGEHDSLRASLDATHKLLSNSTMRLIPNAGTFICDLEPALLSDLLRTFFV
jgi:pimeloyl-ACP methyl ester carboxylesterase